MSSLNDKWEEQRKEDIEEAQARVIASIISGLEQLDDLIIDEVKYLNLEELVKDTNEIEAMAKRLAFNAKEALIVATEPTI